MAPTTVRTNRPIEAHNVGDTSAPLADYFFISGVESSQVYHAPASAVSPTAPADDTIVENEAWDANKDARLDTPGSPDDNTKRRSGYSFEARRSTGSTINMGDRNGTASNRSSVTIKPTKSEAHTGLSDDAFDEALKKFASERDSFLEDIHTTAGAVTTPIYKKPRPRTVRITQDENAMHNGLKGPVGSLQRKLSTMKSMKRQSAAMSRQASVRTSKRLSGYNAVIPSPQPFCASPDMHPLKRRYEPVLLDRYPTKLMADETKRRRPFPDYVPMFAFPNDVSVVSSDERPRSTWHGFAMTNADSTKLYGICLIVWIPLNATASEGLERQCEEWRRSNMSKEERELASSLGERLSAERAKLSRLLAELPNISSGSDEREKLEDEIGAVEEKIGLMTDLLRPVRHGAASKIEGLTEGDTGFWIPRAYGILGSDLSLTGFWKEWLKVVAVPMMNSAILRVPPSSPKVGLWQPLERYVVNLCIEALSPITSITQVEVAVRELRLYARKEAINELPGSRNIDLYALFRCLTIPNVITLFEYALSESRIILLSSHTAMLHLAATAITSLLYPLKWCGILIPVLPQRLIQALEAPCPYIAGVEKRYERLDLPEDDFCIVDLDENTIESTAHPVTLPRPQRRKLMALLQAAAQHHNRYGVPTGPPQYAIETFPHNAFSSENTHVFTPRATKSTLATYVSESSTTFGATSNPLGTLTSVYNAFLQSRAEAPRANDRPSTSSTGSRSSSRSPPSPASPSPLSSIRHRSSVSRNDSGLALQASLKEKRSNGRLGEGDLTRRNSSQLSRFIPGRRPSIPLAGHHPSPSTSSFGAQSGVSNYAPSVYAQSTLAASTVMPQMMIHPVHDDEKTKWIEGHCLQRYSTNTRSTCSICDERCNDESFKCAGCGIIAHFQCLEGVCLVCPVVFRADQVRAAFVRCFASLLYTYRRHLHPASGDRRKAGMVYHFNMDSFLRSIPHGDGEYMHMLRETQAFNEFIHEREATRAEDPSIKLFDEIISSKRNRGRTSFFSKSDTSFLSDTSDHLWRSASATSPNTRFSGDLSTTAGRTPAHLDTAFMKEPRAIQGAPRLQPATTKTKRKPVASMLMNFQSADDL